MRGVLGHDFLPGDVPPADPDVPRTHGYRQLTDAHLLTLARRHGARLVTFDAGMRALDHDDSAIVLLR